MSLRWDITNVEDFDAIQTDAEWGITEAIIWLTIAVDLGGITAENVKDFANRAALVQAVDGPVLAHGIYVTDEMIERRIGLSTNVSDVKFGPWLNQRFVKSSRGMSNPFARLLKTQREVSAEKIAELTSA